MPYTRLEPPNRGALWVNLALSANQLAQLCGVTTRQVIHWTHRGYITAARHNPERYNGDAIDLCILIKQGLDCGLPLRRAAELANAFQAGELARQPGLNALDQSVLHDVREHLRDAEAAIAAISQVVAPLLMPESDQGRREAVMRAR